MSKRKPKMKWFLFSYKNKAYWMNGFNMQIAQAKAVRQIVKRYNNRFLTAFVRLHSYQVDREIKHVYRMPTFAPVQTNFKRHRAATRPAFDNKDELATERFKNQAEKEKKHQKGFFKKLMRIFQKK